MMFQLRGRRSFPSLGWASSIQDMEFCQNRIRVMMIFILGGFLDLGFVFSTRIFQLAFAKFHFCEHVITVLDPSMVQCIPSTDQSSSKYKIKLITPQVLHNIRCNHVNSKLHLLSPDYWLAADVVCMDVRE